MHEFYGILCDSYDAEHQPDRNDGVYHLLGKPQQRGLTVSKSPDNGHDNIQQIYIKSSKDQIGDDKHCLFHLKRNHFKYKVDAQVLSFGDSRGHGKPNHPHKGNGRNLLHPCKGMLQRIPAEHVCKKQYGKGYE